MIINRIKGEIKVFTGTVVLYLAKLTNIDLLPIAYRQNGILNFENDYLSGEGYVLREVLPKYFQSLARPTIFDVGANIGDYSEHLLGLFPSAEIYAFEPNPATYLRLKSRFSGANINCLQLCLGDEIGVQRIYSYQHEEDSQHATLYRNVLTDLHHAKGVIEFECEVATLDSFCESHHVNEIHFLKIDVEGHELKVLMGAQSLLRENKISIIQFEFNEMNIMSRSFLKDFYEVLPQYNFYRLGTGKLIPLGKYASLNEIFKFQNILAIHQSLGLDV